MPSSPSTRLRIEKQASGENLNTWGTRLNSVIDRFEEAVAGRLAISPFNGPASLSSSNYVADQARMAFLDILTGTGGALTVPAVEKSYIVRVAGAVSGDVTITTGSGATAIVAPGNTAVVAIDGTNVRQIGATTADLQAILTQAQLYADALVVSAGNLPSSAGLADYTLMTASGGGGSPAWQTPANARSKLGLGSAALKGTGTSGDAVPLLNAANTWAGGQIVAGLASATASGLSLQPSSDATSERAALALDTWQILQDVSANGVKDFGVYKTGLGYALTVATTGLATFGYGLAVTGNVVASGYVQGTSDARDKLLERRLEDAESLRAVLSWEGWEYTRISSGAQEVGLLAQDVQKHAPRAVTADDAGKLALAYGNAVGAYVPGAVRALAAAVVALRREVAELRG